MSVMVVVGHHMAQANFIDNISIGLCQSSSGQGQVHNVCYSFCYSETNGVPLASICRNYNCCRLTSLNAYVLTADPPAAVTLSQPHKHRLPLAGGPMIEAAGGKPGYDGPLSPTSRINGRTC